MRAAVAWAVAGALVAAACADPVVEPVDGANAVIRKVIDGDTVEVTIGGATERIRLLGIDTPETVDPDRPVECFGPEADLRTRQLLPPGTSVLLVRDIEARDRYGRLLAYVYRVEDGLFVNRTLVDEGLADVLIIAPNDAHAAELRRAAAEARGERRGLWGACQ